VALATGYSFFVSNLSSLPMQASFSLFPLVVLIFMGFLSLTLLLFLVHCVIAIEEHGLEGI